MDEINKGESVCSGMKICQSFVREIDVNSALIGDHFSPELAISKPKYCRKYSI
jgi:hypothetical protein